MFEKTLSMVIVLESVEMDQLEYTAEVVTVHVVNGPSFKTIC